MSVLNTTQLFFFVSLVKQVVDSSTAPHSRRKKNSFILQTQSTDTDPLMSQPWYESCPKLQKPLSTVKIFHRASTHTDSQPPQLPLSYTLLYPPMDFAPLCTSETSLLKGNFWAESWKYFYDNKRSSPEPRHAVKCCIQTTVFLTVPVIPQQSCH